MEKKNRPLQAANQEADAPDITPAVRHTQPAKRTPKKHRARVYMLSSGIEGFTENDILRYCRLSSGRNYVSEIERELDIRLERIDEKNPDGIGSHYRYRFTGRADVLRVISLMKYAAIAGGYIGLSGSETAAILSLYPDNLDAA
ncbi:hypothetical protein [Pantoea piersonii]|uniref:hypothetical protein n=1 Tax=Pantoea piersonii TaxID=2364647 RepID=UPI0028A63937|nr:hypothetical protein [Pantoea piersonii]